MSDLPPQQTHPPVSRRFAEHLVRMPGWHKKVLLTAILLACAGFIGQAAGYFSAKSAPAPSDGSSVPNSSRAFDSGSDSSAVSTDQLPWWQKLSPRATRIGASLVIGFIVGWIFRAFLKTMALITALVVGVLFALSYFNVLNLDLTAARQHYDSAAHWLSDQATRLKDVVWAHIPSGASGALGLFLGARRR